jgi:uncharacterized membrane protein
VWKNLRNLLVTGIFVLLPVVVTVELLMWSFYQLDSILGGILNTYLKLKIPGLGLLALLLMVLLTGMLARNYLGKKLIEFGERFIAKIPILKGIYGTTKQIAEGLSRTDQTAFRKVVLIEYPRQGIFSPGFLTGNAILEAEAKTGIKLLNVFVPTVPNPTTGFLVMVPETEVIYLNMSVEDGFKLILSAGVIKPD